MPYRIVYSATAKEHIRGLTARQRSQVLATVEEQLAHQPKVETKNRKPMRPNLIAPRELRIGTIRVFYDVKEDPEQLVWIEAVGIKIGNRVNIAGEEHEFP